MRKRQRKLTAAEKREKRRRREEYMTIFVRGKQKRIKRPTIHGMDPEEFLISLGDPIVLHQFGMWEYIEVEEPLGVDETLEPPSWWEFGEWVPD